MSGTAGNDTVVGIVDTTTAANTSFSSGDQINGGTGTDVVQVTVVGTGAGGTTTPAGIVMQNVETLKVINAITDGTKTVTFDASTMPGLSGIEVASSITGDTALSNQAALLAATMANGKGDLTINYTSAATNGTADTQNLTLNAQTGGTFTANGVETIAVTASGAASKSVTLASNVGTKVTVAGTADVGFTTAIKTVDATNLTGKLNVTATNTAAQLTGGKGADTFNVSSLTKDVKVVGGDGTDTLVVANTTFASDAFTNVSGVEVLSLAPTAGSTLDVSKVTGVTTVEGALKNTTGATETITFSNITNSKDVTIDVAGTALKVAQTVRLL